MSFILREDNLKRLCEINSFQVPTDEMIFFGFRGCLPLDDENHEFQKEHRVVLVQINHINPHCTLGQWLPKEGKIALFPGSTVPHMRHVKVSQTNQGVGTNQLMTGHFRDYKKGRHKGNKPTSHEAFRQTGGRPIRRTADDFDYDNDDRVEFVNPHDNLHAAWCPSIDHERFASAGCQVVVGYPKCKQRGNVPDAGPWKVFKENAYQLAQNRFSYILIKGRDAQRVAFNGTHKTSARLRFGSQGSLVTDLQNALKKANYYEGDIDDDFGKRTSNAVLEFQVATFGDDGDDGIVGPLTASALEMTWPEV